MLYTCLQISTQFVLHATDQYKPSNAMFPQTLRHTLTEKIHVVQKQSVWKAISLYSSQWEIIAVLLYNIIYIIILYYTL